MAGQTFAGTSSGAGRKKWPGKDFGSGVGPYLWVRSRHRWPRLTTSCLGIGPGRADITSVGSIRDVRADPAGRCVRLRRPYRSVGHYNRLCIDEFELDDQQLMLISAAFGRSSGGFGRHLQHTARTAGEAAAAQDFLRDQHPGRYFSPTEIEVRTGRQIRLFGTAPPSDERWPRKKASNVLRGRPLTTLAALCAHPATMHPSRYSTLIECVTAGVSDRRARHRPERCAAVGGAVDRSMTPAVCGVRS